MIVTEKDFDGLLVRHYSKDLPSPVQIEDFSMSTHNTQAEKRPRDGEQLEKASVASPTAHFPTIFQGKDFLNVGIVELVQRNGATRCVALCYSGFAFEPGLGTRKKFPPLRCSEISDME